MQNISAVLQELGFQFLPGLKPAKNSGKNITEKIAEILLSRGYELIPVDALKTGSPNQADTSTSTITSDVKHKEPIEKRAAKFAEVELRPDQRMFRNSVFISCDGRCIVSGCEVGVALDAAHKTGRHWRLGHNSANDGFLIRKDLHALYDKGLLWFDDGGNVKLAPNVYTDYSMYVDVQVSPELCR